MTQLFTSLFIIALLPFIAKLPLVLAMNKESGGYNNKYPRQQQANLKGFGLRANAAHYNSFEALIVYIFAVVCVIQNQTIDTLTVTLAWVFVASRVLYLICYWFDKASLRSVIWITGMIAAFVMAGRAIWGN
ncbi:MULTISPECIES: MAPEG family protein [Gammaproteobacteria]|uniref:MAPEG family protein n=1 Tax=Gammaproteobacteria TaxID=1236 RepID=UPI000DCF75AB|nr:MULTISPECIES: MAPEG family protein [Gammaproteobacteria]RTE87584.1 MAPEG family protein [Aliidiomarina sp. B3213]TCZ92632.1 MAPEG family protein [Lysobacter sp. N42]